MCFVEFNLRGWIGDSFDHGLNLEQFDLTDLIVIAGLDIALGPERSAGGRMHHLFNRIDHDGSVDPFFFGNLLDNPVQIDCHMASGCLQLFPALMQQVSQLSAADQALPGILPGWPLPLRRTGFTFFCRVADDSGPASIEFMLVVSSLNFVESERMPFAAQFVLQSDPVRAYFHQNPFEILAAFAWPMSSNSDPLAPVRLKILELCQRTVNAG